MTNWFSVCGGMVSPLRKWDVNNHPQKAEMTNRWNDIFGCHAMYQLCNTKRENETKCEIFALVNRFYRTRNLVVYVSFTHNLSLMPRRRINFRSNYFQSTTSPSKNKLQFCFRKSLRGKKMSEPIKCCLNAVASH